MNEWMALKFCSDSDGKSNTETQKLVDDLEKIGNNSLKPIIFVHCLQETLWQSLQ